MIMSIPTSGMKESLEVGATEAVVGADELLAGVEASTLAGESLVGGDGKAVMSLRTGVAGTLNSELSSSSSPAELSSSSEHTVL